MRSRNWAHHLRTYPSIGTVLASTGAAAVIFMIANAFNGTL